MIKTWKAHQDHFSLEQLYELLGVTRQAVHQKAKRIRQKANHEQQVIQQVRQIRNTHSGMGSRPLYYKLDRPGMGINALEELLRKAGMLIEPRRKRIVTTNSRGMSRYPNMVNGMEVNDINQLVVGDITYYSISEKTYYIFDLKDYYSSYIVGLTGNTNMEGYNGIVCLEQMEQLRGKESLQGLIIHTDAGGQYRSTEYMQWLADRGIMISEAKNCLENGCAEQFHGVLKNDYLINYDIRNVKDLHRALKEIRILINEDRPVAGLGFKTPKEYEEELKDIPMSERTKKICYDFSIHYPTKPWVY